MDVVVVHEWTSAKGKMVCRGRPKGFIHEICAEQEARKEAGSSKPGQKKRGDGRHPLPGRCRTGRCLGRLVVPVGHEAP
jgi:hypothetical protein